MAGRIQNRYSSLVRELDITDYAPDYRLGDNVTPVIILHEHCGEGTLSSSAATALGAVGPLLDIVVMPLNPGAYQLALYFSSYVAASADEACAFYMYDVRNGIVTRPLWYSDFGRQVAQNEQLVIPKLHFGEGEGVIARLMTTMIATNVLTMGITAQPI